jgi:hypothetical protein
MTKLRRVRRTCDYSSTRVHSADRVVDVLITSQVMDEDGAEVGLPEILSVTADACGAHDDAMREVLRKYLGNGRVVEPSVLIALAAARDARLRRAKGSRRRVAARKGGQTALSQATDDVVAAVAGGAGRRRPAVATLRA